MRLTDTRLFSVTVVIGLMNGSGLSADSWALPGVATYESSSKTHRFTTTPGQRFVGTPADLAALAETARRAGLAEQAGKLEAAVKAAKAQAACKGRLERKGKDGKYELVWESDLNNGVAPVSVLVSDNGKYVVTLDNWHSVGRGPNVVVIYGPQGKLVRQFALDDFLSREQIARLPISVSSTWWGSGHYLDEKQACVVLRVTQDKDWMIAGKTQRFQEVRLVLATGEIQKDKASPPSRSLADDLRELKRGKGEWITNPVRIKRELTGKEETVTPALAFVPLDKGAKLEDEKHLILGVVESGVTVGELTSFKLMEIGPKRFLVIGEGDKQVKVSYTLERETLKLSGDKRVRLKGEGEIDLSGKWKRKD